MKIMIASDLHGSEYYVSLLHERVLSERPDRLVLLGDLLYHGPRNDLPRGYDTKMTAEILNSIRPRPLCVRGNCDGEVDQMMLDFPILADFAALFVDGTCLYLTHGHRLEEAASAVSEGDVVLCGHTHLPDYRFTEGVWYVNPGSVSIPKGDSLRSYLVFEDRTFFWRTVETGETLRQERLT